MWPNPQEITEEILNGKLRFSCSVWWSDHSQYFAVISVDLEKKTWETTVK